MTKYQAVAVLYEITDEIDFKIALAGGSVEDEDKEATLQDLLGLQM